MDDIEKILAELPPVLRLLRLNQESDKLLEKIRPLAAFIQENKWCLSGMRPEYTIFQHVELVGKVVDAVVEDRKLLGELQMLVLYSQSEIDLF